MLDANQPHDVFNGKDDLYRLLRETRSAINLLSVRVEAIEVMLRGDNEVITGGFIDEGAAEEMMANTISSASMRKASYGKKGRKK